MRIPKHLLVGINGWGRIDWVTWLRVLRHRAESLDGLVKANPHVFNEYNEFEDFLRDDGTGTRIWDTIEPYPIEDLFNVADGRDENVIHWMFQTIGPREIFNYFKDKNSVRHIASATLTSQGVKGPYNEKYSLYMINNNKIPINNGNLCVLECVCPSTLKDHYLYCPTEGSHITDRDPIAALATLCISPIPVKNIQGIYRQGEVYVFTAPKGYPVPKEATGYTLTKEEYLRLIRVQS